VDRRETAERGRTRSEALQAGWRPPDAAADPVRPVAGRDRLRSCLPRHGARLPRQGRSASIGAAGERASAGTARTPWSLLESRRAWHGLRGRGIRIEVDDLEYLETPRSCTGVLPLRRLREAARGRVEIVDPALAGSGLDGAVPPLFHRRRPDVSNREKGSGRSRTSPSASGIYFERMLGHSPLLSRIPGDLDPDPSPSLALPLLTGVTGRSSRAARRLSPADRSERRPPLDRSPFRLIGVRMCARPPPPQACRPISTADDPGLRRSPGRPSLRFFQRRSAGDLMMRLNSNHDGAGDPDVEHALVGAARRRSWSACTSSLLFRTSCRWDPGASSSGCSAWAFSSVTAGGYARPDVIEALQAQARDRATKWRCWPGIETLEGERLSSTGDGQHWTNLFVDVMNVVAGAQAPGGRFVDSLDGRPRARLSPPHPRLRGLLVLDRPAHPSGRCWR